MSGGSGAPPAAQTGSGAAALGAGLLAEVLCNALDGVVICDGELRYVWVNPAACRIMGYPLEELVGRNFLINFPERMHSSMVQAYQAQLDGTVGTFTGTLLRPDGTELDMVWSNMGFTHDGRRYGAAIFRDVTHLTAATRDAAGLAQVAATAAGGAALLDVMTTLAESGRDHTRALTVSLELVDDDLVIRRAGRSGAPAGYGAAQTACSAAGARIPFFDVWLAGRPVVLPDARTRLREDPAFTPLCDCLDAAYDWQTAVYIAIGYRGKVLGGLNAYFPTGVASPTDEELSYLTALADHAALAVEHDRLRRASEHAAALEERTRLARDLHDSVSQALFSMTLHARAADKALDKVAAGQEADPRLDKARADIAALRQLTATALAEMRALIFELRPDALADLGLVAAIARQADALAARSGLTITVTGPDQRLPLGPRAQEHAYRATLEALHNAVKHAAADTVRVTVTDLDDAVEITVVDDGAGFDPTAEHPGHLGLHTMRERAGSVGGTFDLRTAPGRGTTIRLRLPAEPLPPEDALS